MIKISFVLLGLLLSSSLYGQVERDAVVATLDAFHRAAAEADYAAYRGLMTDDMVFLGTDGSERWQGPDFQDFARTRFESGSGWVYVATQRSVTVVAQQDIAWFDELLWNDALGQCRGSGVLQRQGDHWKLSQYNLSVPIPNAMVDGVVAAIANGGPGSGAAITVPVVDDAPDQEPAPETEAEKQDEVDSSCRRKRHKTNRAANC